ncbi:Sodium/calcium exchanger protein-domain-containing protein [Crucibulum laeve]|uniref:Sodium/calcium exchanger protein-domain-containing protein n=1 Tax=Crucibulum laeve TaxID=68775 RepID=A0A5C3M7C8_9AGAR|nr:Sodium/calcium exchanger protein-domain-containing protein [Crucibulum laeve]
MAHTPARLLFVVVLVINCIIWSQSRYSIQAEHFAPGQPSLVKRISYELLNPIEVRASDGNFNDQCRPLAYPTALQCTHVQDDCPKSDTLLSINYLRHYFCTDLPLRPAVFVGLIIWLVFLFSTLGISASDFFTPNLATIAQMLGLDENVAGVTFLAFGNGSPDVFSTFSAMRANSGSLAIGELLGAASFIVSCVVGSMCIIKPFKVHRGPFLRDVGFFTAAVGLVLVILWDGLIHPWEAGVLVGLYLFYVLVVVVGSWWDRRRQRKLYNEELERSEYHNDPTVFEPYRDDPSPAPSSQGPTLTVSGPSPTRSRAISAPAPPRLQTNLPPRSHSRTPSPSPPSSQFTQMPSFSLVGALEFREVVAGLRNQAASSSLSMFETPVTPYAGGHYHSGSLSRSRTPRTSLSIHNQSPWDSDIVPLDERSPRQHNRLLTPSGSQGLITEEPQNQWDYFGGSHEATPVPSIFRTPASPSEGSGSGTEVEIFTPPTKRQRVFRTIYHIYHTLFPTLHRFKEQSILGQIACIFAAPAVLLLTLTLPVVVTPYENIHSTKEKTHSHSHSAADGRLIDFEEEGIERVLIAEDEVEENMHELTFNRWLMAAQCLFGPLFCADVLFGGTRHELWILIATTIAGIAVGTLVAIFSDRGDHPTARMARCSMGFFVAIVWIMAIADEVVNVLQTFGFIFGLSDAIIGLTIFAVGNSLADLVANMSVAVFAPIMGFSACFGGPMLNILLGVGVSGSYIIQQTAQPYALELSTTLFVSSFGLLALLCATLVFVPLNDYFLTRRWGILLIASYTIIMIINIIVELKSK